MVELKVMIEGPDGVTQYSVLVPSTASEAVEGMESAVEFGCALLGASYRKEPEDGVDTRKVQ